MGTHLGAVLLIIEPCWQVDLTGIAPELFAKAANLVHLNLGDTVVNVEQIQAVWSAVEQAPDLQLNKLSMKSMELHLLISGRI